VRFGLLAVLTIAPVACGVSGQFELSWRFADQEADAPFSARECGAHAVESFTVTGTKADGTTDSFVAACGRGSVIRSVSPGTWTVSVLGVDAANRGLGALDDGKILRGMSAAFEVVEDAPPTPVAVVVQPRPSCTDGIDNDSDGAVDRDDLDCSADNPSELPPK
jgi:hypothetical protein